MNAYLSMLYINVYVYVYMLICSAIWKPFFMFISFSLTSELFLNIFLILPSPLQIFIFRGRLIFGPDARSLIITLLLIIVPVIIFCTNVARNLIDEISGNIAGYAILLVTVVFTIYVSSFNKTLCVR